MPIDTSVYSMLKPIDAAGAIQQGFSLREMADQRVMRQKAMQQQEQTNAAYKAGVVQNQDGTTSVDPTKTVSALMAVNPPEGQRYQAQQMQNQKLGMEKKLQEYDLIGRALGGVTDQPSWDAAKANLKKSGVDLGQYENTPYDPKLKDTLLGMAYSAKDKAAQEKAKHDSDRADRHEATYEKDVAVKAGQRSDGKQNQSMQQVQSMLESARGNPAVAQAQKDMYAAQKFESLANLNGDPNKLNPAQVQLAAMEVAKIASGGVPTAHELQGLTPNSIPGSLAELAQKFANHPIAANQGAFVNAMKDYTSALKKDAQGVVKEKFGRVIEARKAQLGDANYKSLQQQYMDPFKNSEPTAFHQMSDSDLDAAYKAAGGK